jgi:hypothetical protein
MCESEVKIQKMIRDILLLQYALMEPNGNAEEFITKYMNTPYLCVALVFAKRLSLERKYIATHMTIAKQRLGKHVLEVKLSKTEDNLKAEIT